MAFRKIIGRLLGRPGAYDVDAVTSILRGRSQPRSTDIFRGFDSPPAPPGAGTEEPPPASAEEKAPSRKNAVKRKRPPVPTPDRF